MKTSLDVLQKARAILGAGWCQNGMAKDAHGEIVPSTDPEAVAFCLIGATKRASAGLPDHDREIVYMHAKNALHDVVQDRFGTPHIASFNDAPRRTKAEVLGVIDAAIAVLRETA